MFASALSISLARDRSVAASRLTNTAGSQHKVDIREYVVDAVRVVFDPASMQDHRCFGAAIDLRSLHDFFGRHAGNLGSNLWRIFSCESFRFFPAVRARANERLVNEVFLNQDVKDSVCESDICSRLQL